MDSGFKASLRRQWRLARWKLHIKLSQRRRVREATERIRESDERENEASSPPPGAQIEWPCLWLTELYGPSHARGLEKGLESLGLASDHMGRGEPLTDWLREARSRGGAWTNLGMFGPDRIYRGGPRTRMDIPSEFSLAQMALHQFAPGITILVAQLTLSDECRSELNDTWHRPFRGEARANKRGGHSLHPAGHMQEEELGRIRERLRQVGSRWIEEHLPGAFTGLEGQELPSWDFWLTAGDLPFFEADRKKETWVHAMGFGFFPSAWACEDIEGLRLLIPRASEGKGVVPTFTGRRDDLVNNEAGGISALLPELFNSLDSLLAVWTLSAALQGYGSHFERIQDELAGLGGRSVRFRGGLRRLQRDVVPFALDLEALERAMHADRALRFLVRDGAAFKELPMRLHSGEEREGSDKTLSQGLLDGLPKGGKEVAAQVRAISSGLRTQSELLLAASNFRLQYALMFFTVIATIAAVYAALVS